MFNKIKKWWLFNVANPVVAKGERGGFKYVFRRFWLEIESVSGNFKVRFTASEHPYGYLAASCKSEHEENVFGFAERMYMICNLLTRDSKLVKDIDKALTSYEARESAKETDDTDSEEAAIQEVKEIQKYVDATPKERKKIERDVNGRFKKAVKK